MLKLLVKINLLRAFSGSSRKKNAAKKAVSGVGVIVLMAVLFAIFAMSFAAMAFGLSLTAEQTGAWFYSAAGGMIAFFMMFIGSVFYTVSAIYESKDNELLLSMPIPPGTIVTARIVSLLLLDLFYGGTVILPFGIVGAITGVLPMGGLLFWLCSVLLILLTAAVTCLIAWAVAAISSRLQRKEIVQSVMLIAFFALYMVFYMNMNTIVSQVAEDPQKFSSALSAVFPLYWFGQGTAGNVLFLSAFAALSLIPSAAVFYLLQKSFISITTRKVAVKKKEYRGGEMKTRSVKNALIAKEISHFLASPMYMVNSAIGLLIMLVMSVLAVAEAESIKASVAELGSGSDFLAAGFAAVMLFMLAMTGISAPSVSLEGKALWIIRSSPVSAKDVLLAKAATHILISLPFALVSSVLAGVALNAPVSGLLIFTLAAAFTAFMAYTGVVINTAMPKFDFVSETAVVKQSGAVGVTLLIGMLTAVLMAVMGFVAAALFSAAAALAALTVLCLGAALLMRLILVKASARKFDTFAV